GSKAYQLSSAHPLASQGDERLFVRMAVKGMNAEQLWESLRIATGYRGPNLPNQPFVVPGQNNPKADFLAKFTNHSDRRTQHQTSILQALSLMNGKFINDATSLDRSETLAGIYDAPWMNTGDRIEALYLVSLARKPRPDELPGLVKYVESGGAAKDSRKALSDVFWAL